ncbi:interleukin-23 subunit alpha isoform X2 [Hyaena hyaena]|uniref:interleukin-23 subunit alpha isoform X2 n=1 Tax=Hyaena hyaena TaxID=95912 RepID=UPI001922163A|nr:interleukin-23 subunit alpha isoform X2 [Hyaena hyaena]
MLGSRAMLLLLLLLLPRPWTAKTRAVPEGSSPAWALGQQLSQKLCTLAWSAHPPTGHTVSSRLWHQMGACPSSPRLPRREDSVALDGSWRVEGPQRVREDREWGSWKTPGPGLLVDLESASLISSLFPPLPPFQDLPREQGDDETTNDVPHIQCEDGCDPQGLRDNSQPEGHHWETEQTPSPSPSQPWQRLLLRFKILRSLQAFVAVAARVFAHGAATLSP